MKEQKTLQGLTARNKKDGGKENSRLGLKCLGVALMISGVAAAIIASPENKIEPFAVLFLGYPLFLYGFMIFTNRVGTQSKHSDCECDNRKHRG